MLDASLLGSLPLCLRRHTHHWAAAGGACGDATASPRVSLRVLVCVIASASVGWGWGDVAQVWTIAWWAMVGD